MKKEISYGAAHGEDRSYSKNEFINQVSERCYPSTWTLGERKKKYCQVPKCVDREVMA